MNDHDCHHHIPTLDEEKKPFYWAIAIAFIFMILEIVGGLIANSLALISDALHMFADVGALALGLVVISIFNRPSNVKKSYGYQRAEVLGALASGAVLWVLMFFLIYEGVERLMDPPEVKGPIVIIIATIGLIANVIMMKLLHPGENGSLNMHAAYLHVLGDLLGSVGVIASGFIIWKTGWYPIDPLVTFLIAILILYSSGKMMKKALDILMEGVPDGIDFNAVLEDIKAIKQVEEVHDLHIWALSSRKNCLSAHVVSNKDEHQLLAEIHRILGEKYKIQHMTIQIEDHNHFDPKYCYDCQNGS